jgi:Lrp/AsnC family leucine-responsive transcriptional regulator
MIDSVDVKILQLLEQNAKLTNKEIAGRLGLTITPIHERIKKLEREGYIEKYMARINRKKIGLRLLAFLFCFAQEPSKGVH